MSNDLQEKAREKWGILQEINRWMDGLLADDPKDV